MKKVPIKLGPLALLLTVISICLTALSILSWTSARADMALAERYARTVSVRYYLEAQGQEYISEYPPSGPDTKVFEQDGSKLTIVLDGDGIVSWKHEREWEEDDSIGDLWDGL